MKFYVLSDDQDTVLGLRLAGIEGKLLEKIDDAEEEIRKISENSEIGMILITPCVAKSLGASLTELKKKNVPLIVEIPDSDPSHSSKDSITDYIREAVGVKI